MANPNPRTDQLAPHQWKEGQSGNPNGKQKGTKNLSTIVKELLENENFEWDLLPTKARDFSKKIGLPGKAIAIVAYIKALSGNVQAMEWLRKTGYGDKVDITSDGKQIEAPLIISTIKPRDVISETETEASS